MNVGATDSHDSFVKHASLTLRVTNLRNIIAMAHDETLF